LAKTA